MPHHTSPTVQRLYDGMLSTIQPAHDALGQHPIAEQITSIETLRIFMCSHVFAVWDFMTLLKSLQQRLTCVSTPWVQPADPISARMINEIVLCEETDEVQPGLFMSHVDLYLAAMAQVGADRTPIQTFIGRIGQGRAPTDAVSDLDVPDATKEFVNFTLRTSAEASTHELAASFLHGREHIIPDMFKAILRRPVIGAGPVPMVGERVRRAGRKIRGRIHKLGFGQAGQDIALESNAVRLYLERHIELDEQSHAPMARVMLMNLCGEDEQKWAEAESAALEAMAYRQRMWAGVVGAFARGQMGEGSR